MRPFACDGIIIKDGKILLIKRALEPFKGTWAVPGGRIEEGETAEQCLKREMLEETGLDVTPVILVGVYSDPKRDPRGIIAVTYICKILGGTAKAGDDAGELAWFGLDEMPKLASDHNLMVEDAVRLIG